MWNADPILSSPLASTIATNAQLLPRAYMSLGTRSFQSSIGISELNFGWIPLIDSHIRAFCNKQIEDRFDIANVI